MQLNDLLGGAVAQADSGLRTTASNDDVDDDRDELFPGPDSSHTAKLIHNDMLNQSPTLPSIPHAHGCCRSFSEQFGL